MSTMLMKNGSYSSFLMDQDFLSSSQLFKL